MTKKTNQAMVNDPIICYVLVRTDAPFFVWGKACAQVHHNGVEMAEDLKEKNVPELNELYAHWQEDRKFGTVLTLEVNAAEMRQAVTMAQILGLHTGITHDPTYPIPDGDRLTYAPVDTCAYVFGRKSECAPVVGMFKLLGS